MSAEHASPLVRFLKEARRRHVFTTAAAYVAVALVLIQIGDALFTAVNLPNANRVFTLILFLAFPLVLVLSWMFDVRGGIERTTSAVSSAGSKRPHPQPAATHRVAPPVEKPRAPTPARIAAAEPAAERVERATLAHIRHELKTPINAIIGYSEMLLEDTPGGAIADDLRRIQAAGRQLLKSVEDILSPEHAHSRLHDYGERIRADLRDPITGIIGYCEMLAETHAHNEALTSDLTRIRTASARLLDLSTDIVQIASGAPATAHFGSATALTQHVLAKLQPLDVTAAEERQGVLLVVDDNPLNRDLLSRQLARKGYEVATAASGAAALAQLDENSFDIVLLDILMPEMDGVEVLRRIRAQNRLDDVAVIMTSSLDEIESVVRCLESGAADYVTKPFDPTLLDARIGTCLKLRRLQQREDFYRAQLEARGGAAHTASSLPAAVLARLDGTSAHIVDETALATVLACDLERLLRGDARTNPAEAANRLRRAFAVLRDAGERHNVEVVTLHGATVLLAAGIPTACDDHADRIADAAASALPALRDLQSGEPALRFGIHTGTAAGSLLGDDPLVYHVWGDAADVARRLEARADPGTVHISTAAHAALKDRYACEGRGVLDIGGRQMRTYILTTRALAPVQ